jgi:hypothetical protein
VNLSLGTILIATVVAVSIAVLLLCVGIIFRKDHSFRSQHIAENERMRENHIHCATSQDREARRAHIGKIDVKNIDL